MKKCTIGLFAHVDAGKTTLSESLLFNSGVIKKTGRVDHQDAFLDYDPQERKRGITIYSKQARFTYKDTEFVLLDTPGHSDLASEMERTISLLDIAILVISAPDGVQAHTLTINNLLKKHNIPTIVFINKIDISYKSQRDIIDDLFKLKRTIVVYDDNYLENVASINEKLLDKYLNENTLDKEDISKCFNDLEFSPTILGSALKNQGVDNLLELLDSYSINKSYPDLLKALVYKISHDENKERLTHIKMLGGKLKVKTLIKEDEKVDQIRIYSGKSYTTKEEISAGEIATLKGLKSLRVGDYIGSSEIENLNSIEPYMNYDVEIIDGKDSFIVLGYLKEIEEENPEIKVNYNQDLKIITVSLMGSIQIEVIEKTLKETYNTEIRFVKGKVNYKETITETSEGIGHYEPLRHYGEVRLLLTPTKRGEGIIIDSNMDNDSLPLASKNIIIEHLKSKKLIGVLTGSQITDIHISITDVRTNLKHTSGQDLIESTFRAFRHGLMRNKSILLEPFGEYELIVPNDQLSKAIFDLETMNASYNITQDEEVVIKGVVALRFANTYQNEVNNYTHGQGRFSFNFLKYDVALNQEEAIEEFNYDPDKDIQNPSGSIFCKNGAGYFVKWSDVEELAHSQSYIKEEKEIKENKYKVTFEEAKRVFESTSPSRNKTYIKKEINNSDYQSTHKTKPTCYIVDGYNLIFATNKNNVDLTIARYNLLNKLCDFKALTGYRVIVVFDAYKKEGGGSNYDKDGVNVIFTNENEIADHYIERKVQELEKDYKVIVVTSDHLEQDLIFGHGALRVSSSRFINEMEDLLKRKIEKYKDNLVSNHPTLKK